jgi:uncharacterized repeat protein (TIGR03803 family)
MIIRRPALTICGTRFVTRIRQGRALVDGYEPEKDTRPQAGNDNSSWKWACALALLSAMTGVAAHAQTFSTLVNFNRANGMEPAFVSLVQGTDGELYGTTLRGGADSSGCQGGGCGTVFKMSDTGTLTTLYSFCASGTCVDGSEPAAGLVQATDGNFYGTTLGGGAHGRGTVFRITPNGDLTTIHSIAAIDGWFPMGALVQAASGDFYGTTPGSHGRMGYGNIFRITPAGALTTLHRFTFDDGANPYAGLVEAFDGDFYGTTESGGASGSGTVFKVTRAGTFTTLYSFTGGASDGGSPWGALIQATDGNLYGTTRGGGTYGNGTIFKITPAGALTTMHSFVQTEGIWALAGLVQGTDGNFYGASWEGGAPVSGGYGNGTVYQMTPAGTVTTLHNFNNSDGYRPSDP